MESDYNNKINDKAADDNKNTDESTDLSGKMNKDTTQDEKLSDESEENTANHTDVFCEADFDDANAASGDKAFDIKDNIDITGGIKDYISDTELEELLRKELSVIEFNKEKEGEALSLERDGTDNDMMYSDNNTKAFNTNDNKIRRFIIKLQDEWNKRLNISNKNFIVPALFIICSLIYLELTAHFLIYRSFDIKILYPILFAVPLGAGISFICGLFSKTVNKFLLAVITGIICLIFNVQMVYQYVFKVYFSFQTLGMAGDALTEFSKEVFAAIKANIGGIILLFLPLIVLLVLINKQIDFRRRGLKEQLIMLGGAVGFHLLILLALIIPGKEAFSPYDIYYNSAVPELCGKQLGIVTLTRLDIGKLLKKSEELDLADTIILPQPGTKPATIPTKAPDKQVQEPVISNVPEEPATPTPIPVDTSPNIMNIDFAALAANEKDSNVRKLHEYFASVQPTNKNEYTGMFKGYNLIQITAEGFCPYAVNKEKTPTLYKLVNEGFVFRNFYTALWQTSTSDGEFVAMTGLIPTGSRNMYNGRNNLWPFALGHQFNILGVKSKAYHNHTYTYYDRDKTHPNLGYIYKGVGNGLVLEHENIWPESDLEMINATVDEYVGEEQFHVYYLTVSGHMNYSFTGNMMSYKNREAVADLPYSDDVKAYIACQIELDKALEELIRRLEEAGVADRTVIALSADHYPYGWEKEKYDELAGHEVDPYFEIYRNNFILWSKGMTENVIIDKPCSSMDMIPTLLNLFGFEYDSRLLMGQDIFSDTPPLVILSNRSFITDKVMYNTETGEATYLTDEALPDGYLNNIINIVKNKFTVSKNILKLDYYRYVFPNFPEEFIYPQ
jgi:hypothetical protein